MTSVQASRLEAQLLSGPPATSAVDVVDRLLAVQAQDPRGARLAVRARSTGLHASDVDAMLDARELVVTWVNRGTLHLVRAQDVGWLHALTTPQLATGNARRLAQEGVSTDQAERGVQVIERELLDGPQTRAQLREALLSKDIPVEGQAQVHLLLLATLRGICLRGAMVGGEQAWVLRRDWLPAEPAVAPERAMGWLAHRYLRGHGPATDRDLARWAGVTLGQARQGLRQVPVLELAGGLLDLPGRDLPPRLPAAALLGAFDPLLLGWVSREPVCGSHQQIVTSNGIFRPIALVGGRAVATWGLPGGRVELRPFAPLSAAVERRLMVEAAAVQAFLQPRA